MKPAALPQATGAHNTLGLQPPELGLRLSLIRSGKQFAVLAQWTSQPRQVAETFALILDVNERVAMQSSAKKFLTALLLTVAEGAAFAATPDPSRADALAARMSDSDGGIVIVAHRGCHNPSPHRGMLAAPENSFAGLEQCIPLGVDAVEVDVRRTRDGHLVLMHDDKVDRSTNGTGRLASMTLAQVKALRLRDNEGGPDASVTTEQVPTLEEMLARAGDRIMLCLDVKEAIFPEVIAAVRKVGATGRVFFLPTAGLGSPVLASIPPFDQVPIFPALLASDNTGSDMPQVLLNQSSGQNRPWGYSLPWSNVEPIISQNVLAELVVNARLVNGRLWANTMSKGTFVGYGGDNEALRDPDSVWGRMFRSGVSMFQTDEPAALVAFRTSFEGKKSMSD